jgi:hypothetical protein
MRFKFFGMIAAAVFMTISGILGVEYLKKPRGYEYINAGSGPSLKSALSRARDGETIHLTGAHTVEDAVVGPNRIVNLVAARGATISGGDSLITVDPTSRLKIYDLAITSTDVGNTLIGEFELYDCQLSTRFQEFNDSLWAVRTVFTNAGGIDSLAFSRYADLTGCSQRGKMWSFGRINTITNPVYAKLLNCDGFSTTTSCLHIPDENRNTTLEVVGGIYHTTANAYVIGAANEANVILDNITAITETQVTGPGGAAFYMHDSGRAYIFGGDFISKNQGNPATMAFYSIYVSTPDTVIISGARGNNLCVVDSSAGAPDGVHSPPIVLIFRANSFEGETIMMTPQEFAARVWGTGATNKYILGTNLLIRDVTTGGYNSGPCLQTMSTAGSNKTLIYPGSGQIKQQGDIYLAGASGRITADMDSRPNNPIIFMRDTGGDSNLVMHCDSLYYRDAGGAKNGTP